jgi:ankyrin repeat protein
VNKSPIWVKIGDFGVSKRIQGDKSVLITRVGTHEFAAPEILGILDNAPESSEYTNAVDIWSFGCVLYYLLTKCLPFPLSKMGLLWKYCTQPTLFPEDGLKARNVSDAGILFIKDLMIPQPSKRKTASAALAAPWIQDQTDSYNNNTEAKSAHLLESPMQDSVSQINDRSSNTVELTSSQDLNKSSRNRKALPLRPQDDKKQGGSQIALRPDIASKRAIQDAQATELLLQNGFDIHAVKFNANEALLWAATEDHEANMVQLLLERGADVAAKDSTGWTALHWAAWNGHETVIRLLLEKGADVAAKDNDGRTALHWAAWNGHETVIRLLLEKGANVAAKDNDGLTALHLAAINGVETVIRLLLEKGADVAAKDSNALTALHLAATKGHEAVVRLLKPPTPDS